MSPQLRLGRTNEANGLGEKVDLVDQAEATGVNPSHPLTAVTFK
jgi:hypothetical protein